MKELLVLLFRIENMISEGTPIQAGSEIHERLKVELKKFDGTGLKDIVNPKKQVPRVGHVPPKGKL